MIKSSVTQCAPMSCPLVKSSCVYRVLSDIAMGPTQVIKWFPQIMDTREGTGPGNEYPAYDNSVSDRGM